MRTDLRIPKSTERLLIEPGMERMEEKVFLPELAYFLTCRVSELKKYARRWGALHRPVTHNYQWRQWCWVSPHIAMRLIALVRARQGERTLTGNDPFQAALRERRLKARKRAEKRGM